MVDSELPSQELDPEPLGGDGTSNVYDEREPESAVVTDILMDETEPTAIRAVFAPEPDLAPLRPSSPPFQATPNSEFNRSQPLLSLAFPTLFPRGQAEPAMSRNRAVGFADHVKHLIKHKSCCFA